MRDMNGQPQGSLNVVAMDPRGLQSLLAKAPFQWWVAGGWALDLFTGESWRTHYDLDVAIARRDQGLAQQLLHGWAFQYEPGSIEPFVFRLPYSPENPDKQFI